MAHHHRRTFVVVCSMFIALAAWPLVAGAYGIDLVTKIMIYSILALSLELLVGLVDTFGKVLLPHLAGMLVYMLMAAVLLWKPEGLFRQ